MSRVLHNALLAVRKASKRPFFLRPKWFNVRNGICGNVYDYLASSRLIDSPLRSAIALGVSIEMEQLCDQWPKSKGYPYPVGGPDEFWQERPRLWRNPLRRELLDWMIEETRP